MLRIEDLNVSYSNLQDCGMYPCTSIGASS